MRVGGNGMVIVGGGIVESVFSYSNPTLTVGTASYPVTRMNFLSATATIGMGTTPASSAAINVDNATYTEALRVSRSTQYLRILLDGTNPFIDASGAIFNVGTTSAHGILFYTGGQTKLIIGATAGESLLIFSQATARVRSGATNGFAIQNSAGTRDNVTISDNGSTLVQNNGTSQYSVAISAALNEWLAGPWVGGNTSGSNIVIVPNLQATAGIKAIIGYYNQTTAYSALEIANTASGFGTLALMKSGGGVVIGTDPGGANALRVGSGINWAGTAEAMGAGEISIGGVTRTTIGANGAASALTAAPLGYLDIYVAGTAAQVPYYNRGA